MAENNQTPINEEEYEAELITLEDEEGKEHTFELVDAADLDGAHYVALVPYVETEEELEEEEPEMIFMREVETDDGVCMDIVEDDAEFEKVGKMFETRLKEFFEFDLQ